jgi:hypothetical protein
MEIAGAKLARVFGSSPPPQGNGAGSISARVNTAMTVEPPTTASHAIQKLSASVVMHGVPEHRRKPRHPPTTSVETQGV